jgi:phage recombination protein Bet
MTSTVLDHLPYEQATAALAIRGGQEMWTDKQRAALVAMGVSKDASNGELAVFMHVCQRTALDPFTRQIYMIPRREKQGDQWVTKQTIQVGIDGFRVIRDRVAEQKRCEVEFEDTIWYDADSKEHAVWLSADPPAGCKVTLIKHSLESGRPLRYPAFLRTASYIQTNSKGEPVSQWRAQAEHMIEKCCEAFATRRAFPNDFAGVYLEEEMGGRHDVDGPPRPASRRVTVAAVTGQPEPPAPDEPVDVEIVDAPCPPALAQEVNAHFKRLSFTAKDSAQVCATAATLAGLAGPVGKVADLTEAQALAVRGELERCGTRDDLVALLAGLASGGQEGEPSE